VTFRVIQNPFVTLELRRCSGTAWFGGFVVLWLDAAANFPAGCSS